jgi:hypothetical protein
LFASYPSSAGTEAENDAIAKTRLRQALAALSGRTQFTKALNDSENVFFNLAQEDEVGTIFAAAPHKFTVEFEYTDSDYTGFGAWSNEHRTHATDEAEIERGVFAYSPLSQTNYSSDPGLSFTAVYEGETVAVDSSGSIYKGLIRVTVDWSIDSNNVSSNIHDLKDVSSNSRFQHSSQDVANIYFADLTANATGDIGITGSLSGSQASARIRYSGSPQDDVPIVGTVEMGGKFVDDSIDGPRGVIGSWKILETRGIDIEGAFGAELVP